MFKCAISGAFVSLCVIVCDVMGVQELVGLSSVLRRWIILLELVEFLLTTWYTLVWHWYSSGERSNDKMIIGTRRSLEWYYFTISFGSNNKDISQL